MVNLIYCADGNPAFAATAAAAGWLATKDANLAAFRISLVEIRSAWHLLKWE